MNTKRFLCLLLSVVLLLSTASFALAEGTKTYTAIGVSDYQTDFNETSALMKTLEEMHGIHLDWTILTSSNLKEQLQLALVNDCPDIFTNDACVDTAKYSAEGILYDITDLIPQYMPNYMKALEEYPDLMERTRQADGRIYSLPRVSPYYKTGAALYINQEWLDKLGLAVPTTTEEFYNVLCAFRDNDCNGNGDASDEIPFTWANTRLDYSMASFMGIFGKEAAGIGDGGKSMALCYSEDGVVYNNRVTEGYKDGIRYLARLYADNLIDPEVFTQDEATFNAKSMGETQTYGAFLGWRVGQIVGDANADKYTIVAPLHYEDVEPVWGMLSPNFGLSVTPHSAQFSSKLSEEDVIGLLKYFDTLFDPYWGEQVRRGTVPELMHYDEETGLFGMNPTPSEYSSSTEWQRSRAIQFLPYASSLSKQPGFKTTASVIQLYARDDVYGDYIEVKNLPLLILSVDDSNTIATIKSNLDLYMNEKAALWISGAEDVDAGWDAYIAQCNTYGLQTWIDIIQDYCDDL